MTHRDKSAVRGLIEELLAGGGDVDHADAMRRLLQAGLQELIEAEVAARIGAGRYERSEQRSTHRNGVRAKQLATPAGQVELAIPKLREGSFFPSLLEPRRRIDQALWAVIAQAWIQGVSTRRVDQLVKALGNEAGISRSQVSRICAEIDEYVAVFLTRRLDENGCWYPYVWLDATYVDVRLRKAGGVPGRGGRHHSLGRGPPRNHRDGDRGRRNHRLLDRVPPRPTRTRPEGFHCRRPSRGRYGDL